MGKKVMISENTFNAVKAMLAGGTTVKAACQYLQISNSLGYRISTSGSWEEYQQKVADLMDKQRENRGKKRAANTKEEQPVKNQQIVTVPWAMMQEIQKTNELLTLISKKLAFIVEQLS